MVSSSSTIRKCVSLLTVTVMQILQVTTTKMVVKTPLLWSPELVLSSLLELYLSFGPPRCKQKLLSPLWKQSAFSFDRHEVTNLPLFSSLQDEWYFCLDLKSCVSCISTVFEDNSATRILAITDPPRLTPHSKHITIKYHGFCSHLSDKIIIVQIPTEDQKGGSFTKPLELPKSTTFRRTTCRW